MASEAFGELGFCCEVLLSTSVFDNMNKVEDELQRLFQTQLTLGRRLWRKRRSAHRSASLSPEIYKVYVMWTDSTLLDRLIKEGVLQVNH